MSRTEIAISELVHYLKRIVDNTEKLKQVKVVGELSNVTRHPSGHWYFTLKDDKARLDCVMFRTYNQGIKFDIEEGQKVVLDANVTIYEPTGKLQLFVTGLSLKDDIGDLYAKYQALYTKYEGLGYFKKEHKKVQPLYPMNIAVLSAKEGAATQDVFHVLARRWPYATIHFYPCLVQGNKADVDIIKKLKMADQNHHDAILLVRGGGSIEDLWCFNSEALIEQLYHMETFVMVGVGHEPDHTLVEFVADRFGPTPSAAAELLTPNKVDVQMQINEAKQKLIYYMNTLLDMEKHKYERFENYRYFLDPLSYIQNEMLQLSLKIKQLSTIESKILVKKTQLDTLEQKLIQVTTAHVKNRQVEVDTQNEQMRLKMKDLMTSSRTQFASLIQLLDAYSPLHILQRGYSIAYRDDKVIDSISQVEIEDTMRVQVSDGLIVTKVIGKE